jgi:hypothetical protein
MPFVQGHFWREPLSITFESECRHCARPLWLEINSELHHRAIERGSQVRGFTGLTEQSIGLDSASRGARAVNPEREAGSHPQQQPLWEAAGAPRRHTWLWAVAALAWVIAWNPFTAERYARSHFVTPWAVGLVWIMDLSVLILGALLARDRRQRDAGGGPELRALAFGILLAVLCLEGLLRIFPAVALPSSLERERGWRSSHPSERPGS